MKMKVRHVRRLFLACALIIVSFKLVYFLFSTETYLTTKDITGEKSNQKQPLDGRHENLLYSGKHILLMWGKRWHNDDWPPEGYLFDDCVVTYNRSKMQEAKAVLFHSTTLDSKEFPWKLPRLPNQLYIWWNSETPAAVFKETPKHTMKDYNHNFFNWTMTYRLSADIVWNYGYRGDLIEHVPMGKSTVDRILKEKTNTSITLISNCDLTKESQKRLKYVEEMMQGGVSITRLGKCYGKYMSKEEMDSTIRSHKFYLAFENARHCRDYITEKFWDNALKNDAVPVVLGPLKEDLLKVAPLNSFIFAEDFDSPADLASYLVYLDKNEDEYRKFFKWREDASMTDQKMIKLIQNAHPGIVPFEKPESPCTRILKNRKTKIIKSLIDEIVADDPPECLQN